jgi:hypothetical protein
MIKINDLRKTLGLTIKRIGVVRFLITANILDTLMMEAIGSLEISVLTGPTRRHIPEDGILHSHRNETLKSRIALTGWAQWGRRYMFPVW